MTTKTKTRKACEPSSSPPKVETLTIPELCKRMEKELICSKCNGILKVAEYKGEIFAYCFSNGDEVGHDSFKILSINDKFPTDICETCGHEQKGHLKMQEGLACGYRYNGKEIPKQKQIFVCGKAFFMPLLRKVVGIKLTERCECGKTKDMHWEGLGTNEDFLTAKEARILDAFQKRDELPEGLRPIFEGECKQYKPVQMVEITTEG